jgi:hypothetical protein
LGGWQHQTLSRKEDTEKKKQKGKRLRKDVHGPSRLGVSVACPYGVEAAG